MLKNIAIALGLLALTFLIGLFMMPPKIELIRYVDVKAPPEKIWTHLSTVEAWDSWDPWAGKASNGKRPWKEGFYMYWATSRCVLRTSAAASEISR